MKVLILSGLKFVYVLYICLNSTQILQGNLTDIYLLTASDIFYSQYQHHWHLEKEDDPLLLVRKQMYCHSWLCKCTSSLYVTNIESIHRPVVSIRIVSVIYA